MKIMVPILEVTVEKVAPDERAYFKSLLWNVANLNATKMISIPTLNLTEQALEIRHFKGDYKPTITKEVKEDRFSVRMGDEEDYILLTVYVVPIGKPNLVSRSFQKGLKEAISSGKESDWTPESFDIDHSTKMVTNFLELTLKKSNTMNIIIALFKIPRQFDGTTPPTLDMLYCLRIVQANDYMEALEIIAKAEIHAQSDTKQLNRLDYQRLVSHTMTKFNNYLILNTSYKITWRSFIFGLNRLLKEKDEQIH